MKAIQVVIFVLCMFTVGACSGNASGSSSSYSFTPEPQSSVDVDWMGDDKGIIYAYVNGSVTKEVLEKDAESHCQQYKLMAVFWKDKETDYSFVTETLFKCERPEYVNGKAEYR